MYHNIFSFFDIIKVGAHVYVYKVCKCSILGYVINDLYV